MTRSRKTWLSSTMVLGGLGFLLFGAGGVAAEAQHYTTYKLIHAFAGGPGDGAVPSSGVVADATGRLYGTTAQGGAFGGGVIYRLTTPSSKKGAWVEEILHSFSLADGTLPLAPVTLGADGTIYGTTSEAGTFGLGSAWKLSNDANLTFTVLHQFTRRPSSGPSSGVSFGPNGLLYGTTAQVDTMLFGGSGTDYSISPNGDTVEYSVIHTFATHGDGNSVHGLTLVPQPLAKGFSGFLGTAALSVGDTTGTTPGNVYSLRINPDGTGTETILYTFGPSPDVNTPPSPPIFGYDRLTGLAFGCAVSGGNGQGGIYQLTDGPTGALAETVVHPFAVGGGDARPLSSCSVVQATSTGVLLGVSDRGGAFDQGAFYQLTPPTSPDGKWGETVKISFVSNNPGTGSGPAGNLLILKGVIYGVLSSGLANAGGVFEVQAGAD